LAGLASAPELAGVGANVLAGLRATGQRQRREEFGPWEGIIEGEAARRQLAERFGPKHVIGATALENYAGCPFRFFLDKVCRVEPLEEFALETDFLARGSQMHEALVLLHRRLNAERGVPSSPAELSPEAFEALVDASLDTVFAGESTSRVAKALAQVNRRVIRRWLLDYHRQHASYDGLWEQFDEPPRPLLFEASFGRAAREQPPGESAAHEATSGETGHQAVIGGGDDGVAEPLEFVHGQTCVRVSGRVDRVDLGTVAGQDVFNVIDYKTGGAARLTPETILSGRVLQPALYAIAVAELLLVDRDTVPWRAGYWRVRDRGFDARGALELYNEEEGHVCPDPGWDELRGRLSHTVVALVQSICAGRFPVYNPEDRCTAFCPFRTVCRVGQVRALEKVWVLDEPA
jgi:RecB family exonuclease